jgi:hypothetical protein
MSYLLKKKSVLKRKIKNLKKTQETFLVGFFRWVFWVGFLLPTLQAGGLCGRAARRTHRQAATARRSRLLQRGRGLPAA